MRSTAPHIFVGLADRVSAADWALRVEDGAQTVDLDQGGVSLIVWRKQWQVQMDRLTQPEWILLQAFAEGITLEQVCQRAIAQSLDVSEYLPDFIARGWLIMPEIS